MSINLSHAAAQHIINRGGYLRITVKSGGCSGFRYLFSIEKIESIDDSTHIFTVHGATIIIDSASFQFIKDAFVDYKEDMMSAEFTLSVPNTSHTCGCGNSFNI
jgi:iron-sulfur cluster assembly accessory protein